MRHPQRTTAKPRFSTLLHCLRQWAHEQPNAVAFTFVEASDADEQQITYAELDRRARAIAATLQQRFPEGERAVLLYPPGLDYIAAFLGCAYAKLVAVPAYPPDPGRLNRSLPRLQAIVANARAQVFLTTAMIKSMVDVLGAQAPELAAHPWLATDELAPGCENAWREPDVAGETLAFLQYTSGSTGTPKGVMVTHSNLMHNSQLIGEWFELDERSVAVNWLPPYHDMGLIGGILQPLYNNFHGVLLSPITFLQRPLRWLQAITRHRGTCAGGPNFAFDLCARKVKSEELAGLDLSTWDVAFCGAEPIRPETLDRFARAFAPAGFRREASYPCYGLAEATLLSAGGLKAEPARVQRFDGAALRERRGVASEQPSEGDVALVSCGTTLAGQSMLIVDPETATPCSPGRIGEIWMSGPSVAMGYWGREEETARTFGARLASGEGPYLRTGDLGLLRDGELYIAGRLKDIIILRGRNYYPQDIEKTAEESHPAVRPGCSAAFSIVVDGEERVVVVAEVNPRSGAPSGDVAHGVAQAIAEEHQISVHEVVLVEPGSIPKTSSGKIQRYASRAGFLDGSLSVLAAWRSETQSGGGAAVAPTKAPAPGAGTAAGGPGADTSAWLRDRVASLLGLRADAVDPRASLTRYGLDSLQSLELRDEIARAVGVVVPLPALLQGVSLDELAALVQADRSAAPSAEAPAAVAETGGARPLSHGQRALWFLHELAPASTAYHVARAVRVRSQLDVEALRRAFQALVDRHAALRTTFDAEGGEPWQRVAPSAVVSLDHEDAAGLDEAELRRRIEQEADRPFDLRRGPLMRARVWTRARDEHVLLLAMHHMITDFWSLSVMVNELAAFYEAASAGAPPPALAPAVQLPDFVDWQRRALASAEAAAAWAYWQEQLAGPLPVLELATDRPRPAVQTFRGGVRHARLGRALTDAVYALARDQGATPYMTLLAAFSALLHRYTGQRDILIGSPTTGRARPGLASLVGYVANPIALRARLAPTLTFVELLGATRQTVLRGLEHEDVPFAALVERLAPERDASRSPIFQVMFVLQQPQTAGAQALAALALDVEGEPLRVGGLRLEPTPLARRGAQFDLTLAMARVGDELVASIEFNADLFDEGTVDRMLGHLRVLLAGVTAAPERAIGALPLLTEAEQRAIVAWNARAGAPLRPAPTLHDHFAMQVARAPTATALEFEGEALTYAELDRRANQLAWYLRELGVGPEVPVGVCLERSIELVVGLLAILKAGGAYVPFDPSYPPERLRVMLEDAAAPVLLTERRLVDTLPPAGSTVVCLDAQRDVIAAQSDRALPPSAGPDNAAYVIFTSGSTGRPKGAVNAHGAVVNRLMWMQTAGLLEASDRVLQKTPFSFDVSVWELFGTLVAGACLVVARPGGHRDSAYLARTIDERRISVAHFVPSMLRTFLDEQGGRALPPSLRHVICSGEALDADLASRFLARAGSARLHNLYGPTEAAVDVTAWECERGRDEALVPIGYPIAGNHIRLLDASGQPVPIGVPGELYIGGVGVARGYLGRPALTAERFVPDPFGDEPGARLYRTGDLARYRPDGAIEFLGRTDHQVKLRGFRIELSEIELALSQHAAVRDAAVLLQAQPPGDPALVAYVAPREGGNPSARELREHLAARLPAYMVPAWFVVVEALPLGPSGKLDRRALAELSPSVAESDDGRARTPVEEVLVQLWTTVLGRERVGASDDFFAMGGHSLLATQLMSRVRGAFGVDVPLQALFEAPTVRAFAARIEAARAAGAKGAPPLVRREAQGPAPLSFAQERLWLFEQLAPGTAVYNMPIAVRLHGALDAAALERAMTELVARHEALRTVLRADGPGGVQIVLPPAPVALRREDLRALPEADREARARELERREAEQPFDLVEGPLLRTTLLALGDREHVLLVTMHHVVADGWSLGVFVRELGALYAASLDGRPPALPALTVQYSDYAVWQRRWLEAGELERQIDYFRRQLEGLPRLQIRADRPRPPVQSFRGRNRYLTLPKPLTDALEAMSRREGCTLFMALLAVFNVVLQRHSGQDDIAVGTDIASRNQTETEGLIGFFTNQLVLRSDLSGSPSFRELLARVRATVLDAYAHQNAPFAHVVRALRAERDASGQPLFQYKLVLQNAPLPALDLPGLRAEPIERDADAVARWDVLLDMRPGPEGLTVRAEYSTDLFDEATIERLWSHFLRVAEQTAADPLRRLSDLELTTEDDLRRVEAVNAAAARPRSDALVHELFAAAAAAAPGAAALEFEDARVTYGELERRANRLAHHLRALGVGPEVRVGLLLERSLEMAVGLLGILKAGGAYVPLDPSHPAEHLAYQIEDARVQVVVATSTLADDLPAQWIHVVCVDTDAPLFDAQPEHAPDVALGADAEAYVLYTSGSTGRPKGVSVPHRAIVRLVREPSFMHLGPDETLLQMAPLAFDASTLEIWGALLNGARLVIFPPRVPSLRELGDLIERAGVTTLWLTAGLFHQMVDGHIEGLAPLRQLLAGGDVLSPASVRRFVERFPRCRLINGYGPTENTTFSCCHTLSAESLAPGFSVPIGTPISGTRVYVLDERLRPLPPGMPGELCVGGAGLARGYINHPALTAERFVPDAVSGEPGARLYRTGDRARLLPDGTIEYLGRIDRQVKVRGFRIEPGEVEAALRAHPGVREALVAARDDEPGQKMLVAYLIAQEGAGDLAADELRRHLQQRLPAYMTPSAFVTLSEFPLTRNGKVDHRALPAPATAALGARRARTAPRTANEEVLAAVWAEVLRVDEVGVDDNFFDAGGDSIRAIQVVARAQEHGLGVTVDALLQHQTIRALAGATHDGAGLAKEEGDVAPFSMISERDRARMPEDAEDAYPIVMLQAGMLFHSQRDAGSALYHDAFSFHLEMELDVARFEQALCAVIERHSLLRTSFDFVRYDEPLQIVHRAAATPLTVDDLRHVPASEQEAWLDDWLEGERRRPFPWASPPLLRVTLHRRTDETVQLSLVFHHAILDGWSVASMVTELLERYVAARRGAPLPLPPPPRPYREFVMLERQTLRSEQARLFWRGKLEGIEPESLTRNLPARAAKDGQRGVARHPVSLDPSLAEGLRELARAAAVPLKSVLLAAHLRVLSLASGSADVTTGIVWNGRPEASDSERTLGLFLNSAPLRQRLAGGTWRDLVRQTFAAEREAHPFRRYPMARLQQDLGGRPPFEALFNYVHFHVYEAVIGISDVRLAGPVRAVELLDLPLTSTFNVDPVKGGLELTLNYDADRLDGDAVAALGAAYATALAAMAARPDERYELASLMGYDERRLLLVERNATRADVPAGVCVHELIEAQVERTPDAPALSFEDTRLTYRELDRRAERVGRALQAAGVGPDDLVAVCLKRSADMLVALLGVLKAGAAYLPIEPDHPADRIALVLDEARPAAALTTRALGARLPLGAAHQLFVDELEPSSDLPPRARRATPRNLAYVLYTSGSTGRPKGVMIEHRNLVNHFAELAERIGAGEPGTWLAVTNYTFDISVTELLWPLTRGYHVVVRSEDRYASASIAEQIERYEVTHMQCTPSRAALLVDQPGAERALGRVRSFLLCGEAFLPGLAARLRALLPGALVNCYGPTETTIYSTTHLVEVVGDSVPIGGPLINTELYLVDGNGVPVPPGFPGELWIGGEGVTRGYLRRPDITAERFLPDVFSGRHGARVYRTGDLCRYRPDGLLEYIGRVDDQVKIRGYRVELGEIEAALRACPGVREAAVVARREEASDQRLIAYITPRDHAAREVEAQARLLEDVRASLRQRLPEYMMPSAFVTLDALPLTVSGKIDRRSLPAPPSQRQEQRAAFAAPQGDVEARIAEVMQRELGLDRVGRDDNFFDLGGNSLLIARVQGKLLETLGREVPIVALFAHPTVAALAAYVATPAGAEAPERPELAASAVERQRQGADRLRRMARKVKL
ncbi:amino acid adenylation domain-containing protein [Sorangium sp. So ce448]|uniref:amino acid adenylation domain-containing protein n=1 Tax=Sorangium sp. So ce448 TaxID=3133314 RepID=UPI003F5DD426